MIIHEKNEKTLVIPSALGNFGNGGGTGGVSSGQVVEIVESAITEYDNTIEPKIEALSGATSALSEDITLLETTVGNHTTDIEALSGATEQLEDKFSAYTPTSGFATINGSGITNGGNLVIAGGATAYYLNDMTDSERAALYSEIADIIGSVDYGAASASTVNEDYAFFGTWNNMPIQIELEGFYYGRLSFGAALASLDEGEKNIRRLQIWLNSDGSIDSRDNTTTIPGEVQMIKGFLGGGTAYPFRFNEATSGFSYMDSGNEVAINTGDTYSLNGSIYWFLSARGDWANAVGELPFEVYSGSAVTRYTYPIVSIDTINETISGETYTDKWNFDYGDFIFSLKTNEASHVPGSTLTFTKAQAGGSSVRSYILNRMTQQELKDLYDELAPYGTPNTGVNSAFTPSEWAFFLQYQDNEWDFGGDGFRGILPLTIASIHPGDYGGAIFFTGVAGSRSNRNSVLKVRYIVTSDGSIDKNAGWIELPTASPWGFSWPDNGKLCYDADNSKFVMVNWYDPSSDQRDVDTTGNTFGISAAAAVDRFLNEGNWYADDRNGYAQPRFEMTILSGGSVYSYVFPSIFGETITSTTIDGQTYTRRYSFTYTREDGSAFVVNMLLNNDQYGAQIEYENVESGGGEGITAYYLNKMTQAELAALYAELNVYRNSDETPNVDEEEGYPAGKYRFFNYNSNNDEFKGYYELQLARFDGSNRIDFSANFQSRYNSKIFQKGIRLYADGTLEERFSNSANLTPYELPAATDQVLGGVKIGSGITVDSGGTISVEGGDGLVHLETLSGVTGETDVVYECDGELFWWNENSGYTGFWSEDMAPFTAATNDYAFGMAFSTIPEGTAILSGACYLTSSSEKWNVLYSGGNIVVEKNDGTLKQTLNVGDTWSGKPHSSLEIWITYEAHYIGIAFYGQFKIADFWNGQANGAHWELVDKEVCPYLPKNFEEGVLQANKNGYINHKVRNIKRKQVMINGALNGNFLTDNNTSALDMFVPSVGGTAGQMLQSNGNAAPTWTTLIKSVKITTDEYEALVQAGTTDPNTLYLIDDE